MSNVVSITYYAERMQAEAKLKDLASTLEMFTTTVNETIIFLNRIVNDGLVDAAAYEKFTSSNAKVSGIINRINDAMLSTPNAKEWCIQKQRYRMACIAIIGCYTASMF